MNKLKMANALRFLSADAIQKANSGHPGMPMGMADVATVLFSEHLKFNPQVPNWYDRDRFILSAGHGSMLIYSLLFLTGYKDIGLDDIKSFRQLGSKAAGHPESHLLSGIETTTGPLGQGVAAAVGMALSERMLNSSFGDDLVNHHTYAIAGDGCLMEGISQEAISFAGRQKLNKLILLWDNNKITIEGATNLATVENIPDRFKSSGWNVISIDGHNMDEINQALTQAKSSDKPVLIDCETTIGFGSPNKAGTESVHGAPLGKEELIATRKALNWEYPEFEIPEDIMSDWNDTSLKSQKDYSKWIERFNDSSKKDEFKRRMEGELPNILAKTFQKLKQEHTDKLTTVASRKASNIVLEAIAPVMPELLGGSADLTPSNLTKASSQEYVFPETSYNGSYVNYGVREHFMGAALNGILQHGGFKPYGGTFFVFADYMRASIRLAALMGIAPIYIFTHDSIGVGEDGPTHQPVETLASLRCIPNLNTFRPCDIIETIECWELAIESDFTPSALILTRQDLPIIRKSFNAENLSSKGAYFISGDKNSNIAIYASGSEVLLAVEARDILKQKNIDVAVVSVPSMDLFNSQDKLYKDNILAPKIKVACEAGIRSGWGSMLDRKDSFIGMDSFGESAPAKQLFEKFNITTEAIVQRILELS